MVFTTKVCPLCNASFVPKYKEQKYCDECMSKHPLMIKEMRHKSIEDDITINKFNRIK